jgi:hypothetical protein
MQNLLIYADQTLTERDLHLAIQTELNAAAERRLKTRLQELGVDEGQPADAGLMGTIAAEEQLRDKALQELDRLRRLLSGETKRRDALAEENIKLAAGLPQPSGSEGQPKSDVAVTVQPTGQQQGVTDR